MLLKKSEARVLFKDMLISINIVLSVIINSESYFDTPVLIVISHNHLVL